MPKKQEREKLSCVTAGDREIELFKTQDDLTPAVQLSPGIIQVTPIMVKFDEPGQNIHGQYLGCTKNISRYDRTKMYYFHQIKLPNGVVIGFSGSKQLDDTLVKINPCELDVHIVYAGDKELPDGKSFKVFHIFTKVHRDKNPPPKPPKYDEFGNPVIDDEPISPFDNGDRVEDNIDPETGEIK